MVVGKPAAVLVLFGIHAVNANAILPRKYPTDFVTFKTRIFIFSFILRKYAHVIPYCVFLVGFGCLSGHLLENSCSLGL